MNKYNLKNCENYKYPWYIKIYKNKPIITIKDLILLFNIENDLNESKDNTLIFRRDWNALGQGKLREEFEEDNQIYYEDEILFFLYLSGFFKILKKLINENKFSLNQIENILSQ